MDERIVSDSIAIPMTLTETGLTITPARTALGSIGDIEAVELAFTRPEGYEADELVLFTDNPGFNEVSLGTENTYLLPAGFPRARVSLVAGFVSGTRRELSNAVTLTFRATNAGVQG